jgi:hypothetical protein
VVVWNSNNNSNFATLPVASTGATCSDQNTGYSGTELATLLSQPKISIGALAIGDAPSLVANPVTLEANFTAYTPAQFLASLVFPVIINTPVFDTLNHPQYSVGITAVSIGSCVTVQEPQTYAGGQALDAGAVTLNSTATGAVSGPGGKQVGPFTAQAAVPVAFSWQGATPNWLNNLTITWSNPAAQSFVQVYGLSSGNGLYTSFSCSVPASAGTFTVPSVVLRAMTPVVGFAEDGFSNPSFLAVTNFTFPQNIKASGIDFGTIYGFYTQEQNE